MTEFVIFVSEQWVLVTALLVLVAAFFWLEGRRGGASLSTHEATRLLNSGNAIVVDVREAKEFKAGHIVDAVNLPYAKLKDSMGQLNPHKDKTLILVDKMGQHTGAAGRQLQQEGYTVNRLSGGMSEWENQKLPLVK